LRGPKCSARLVRRPCVNSSFGSSSMTDAGLLLGASGMVYRTMTPACFCTQSSETTDHLLVTCPFSREIWFHILRQAGQEGLLLHAHSGFFSFWWSHTRKLVPKSTRRGFDTLVVLIAWILWKERNDRIFDRRVRTIQEVCVRIEDEITAWSQAGFRHLDSLVATLVDRSGREIMLL